MSLLTRKRTLLAKIESVYGTDPTPSGAANAMLIKNLEVQPLSAETVSRDLIRPYLGNSETLIAAKFATANFEVELVGAGYAGLVPAYGPLLRACGFAQDANTAAITSITRTSNTATVTTTAAHGLATGARVVISGAVESDYNGNFTITVTGSDTFTYPVENTPSTPATGTPVLGTDVTYNPISDSHESATIYFNVDGVLHKLTGARGSVEFGIAARQIPTMKFTFTGLYNAPSDAAAPTCDFSGFMIPQVANTSNTPTFSLFSYSGILESMALNMANEVVYRTLIGSEDVRIVDRKPAGTFVIEAPTVAAKDFWSIAEDGDLGVMNIIQGSVTGYKVQLNCPTVNIQNPSYQDSQGVQMLSIPFTAVPDDGDDELSIIVK